MATQTTVKERPILFSAQMVNAILAGRKTQTRRTVKPQPEMVTDDLETFERDHDRGCPCMLVGPSSCPPGYRPMRWFTFAAPWNGRINCLRQHRKPTPARVRNAERWLRGYYGDKEPRWSESEVRSLCPYGVPGDRLYVREAWCIWTAEHVGNVPHISYRDIDGSGTLCWTGGYPVPAEHHDWARSKMDGKGRPGIHLPRWASRITLEVVSVRVEQLQDISEADAVAEGCDGKCPVGFVPAYRAGPYSYHFAQLWQSINGPNSWEANPWVWVIAFKRIERTA